MTHERTHPLGHEARQLLIEKALSLGGKDGFPKSYFEALSDERLRGFIHTFTDPSSIRAWEARFAKKPPLSADERRRLIAKALTLEDNDGMTAEFLGVLADEDLRVFADDLSEDEWEERSWNSDFPEGLEPVGENRH